MSKHPIESLMDAVEWHEIDVEEQAAANDGDLPYITHEGVLGFAGFEFKCYQLSTGERLIDAVDVEKFFGGDQ